APALIPDARARIDAALAKYPRVSLADLQSRFADLPPLFGIPMFQPTSARVRQTAVWFMRSLRSAVERGIRLLAVFGAGCVVFALLFKEGPLYRVLGIAIVQFD